MIAPVFTTRLADNLEEAITIVCKHDMQRAVTDSGDGYRCSKCSLFFADHWFCPHPVLAEACQ